MREVLLLAVAALRIRVAMFKACLQGVTYTGACSGPQAGVIQAAAIHVRLQGMTHTVVYLLESVA